MSLVQEKWNRRYAEKSESLSPVPEALKLGWSLLKPGSVLDLASGDGGSSLFLASKGFDVTAVDIAEEGLKRLTKAAQDQHLTIRTVQSDLDVPASLIELGQYDNILINRFRPTPALFLSLPALLHQQGRLMLNSFNLQQHKEKGFSERFCLLPQEYVALSSELSVQYYRSEKRADDFMDEYLFIKN